MDHDTGGSPMDDGAGRAAGGGRGRRSRGAGGAPDGGGLLDGSGTEDGVAPRRPAGRSDEEGRAGVVLVLGSLSMDHVVPTERIPAAGDSRLGGTMRTSPGGRGANQAVAAVRSGSRARLLGRVGDDAHGASVFDALVRNGVDTSLVRRLDGPTGVAFVAIDGTGRHSMVVSPGANARLGPGEITPDPIEGADVVLAQLESPLETVRHLAEIARDLRVPFVLHASPATPLDAGMLELVTVLVVSAADAEAVAGLPPLESGERPDDEHLDRALASLLDRGVEAVVATQGAGGVTWRQRMAADGAFPDMDTAIADLQEALGAGHPDGVVEATADGAWGWRADVRGRLSPHRVRRVDATAAGDAFCGALAARLARGEPFDAAVAFANAAGALAAAREGGQPSLPEAAAVLELLAGAADGSGEGDGTGAG